MLKSDALTTIRQLIDDPSAKRWVDANLGFIANMTLDSLWADIFEVNAHFNSWLDTVTPKAEGYIDVRQLGVGYLFTDDDVAGLELLLGLTPGTYATLSALMVGETYASQTELYDAAVSSSSEEEVAQLQGGGGQLSYRLFRLQKITREGMEYGQARPSDFVLEDGEALVYDFGTHIQLGDQLYLLPLDDSTEVELRYSFLPTLWTDLQSTDTVPWPVGFEGAYLYEIAGRLMTKGGAEDPRVHLTVASTEQKRMLRAIRNRSVGPAVMLAADDAVGWGSLD